VVGLDLGARRIGVAVSDSAGSLAMARCTLSRSGDDAADRRQVVALVMEAGASLLVVGLPLSLDGSHGPAARDALGEAAALRELFEPHGIGVETFDERFTTASAERQLAGAGHRGPSRRRRVDETAAAVILQAWLDTRREREGRER